MVRQGDCFGAWSGEAGIVLLISHFLLLTQGWPTAQSRWTGLPHTRDCLECQVQHLQDQVDGFYKDERDDDATDAVDQQVPVQEWPRPNRAVLDATQCQRDQR